MNQLIEEIHQTAKEKGWWETFENGQTIDKPSDELRMLVVSEIAEATEAVRDNQPPVWAIEKDRQGFPIGRITSLELIAEAHLKPEGEAVELADAVIRICDIFGARKWNLSSHLDDHVGLYPANSALGHHMQFVEFVVKAKGADEEKNLGRVVVLIKDYFESRGWDLEKVMRLKMDYNKTRPFRHGNKSH